VSTLLASGRIEATAEQVPIAFAICCNLACIAMIEHLLHGLPAARKAALQQEITLLRRSIQRIFLDGEDRARAQTGALQGIGSSESESLAGTKERKSLANTLTRELGAREQSGTSKYVRANARRLLPPTATRWATICADESRQ